MLQQANSIRVLKRENARLSHLLSGESKMLEAAIGEAEALRASVARLEAVEKAARAVWDAGLIGSKRFEWGSEDGERVKRLGDELAGLDK
jgi:hypothetical protein